MQKYYKQKRKSLVKLKASLIAMLFVLFAMPVMAQTNNVYMHTGETYVGTSGLNFYDSGGASHGPANYWNHWFGRSQDFTHTFRPQTEGQAIQVDFEEFEAYTDNNGTNDPHALQGKFSLRLNDAELYVYEGTAVNEDNLITVLTGTIVNPFTIMANGPITFRFKSYSFTEEGWGAKVKAIPASDYKPQAPAISMEVCSDLIVLNATTLGAQIRYTTDGTTPTANTGTVYTEPFEITYPKTVKAITVLNNVASVNAAEKQYTTDDATPTPAKLTDDDVDRDVNHIIITPPTVPDRLNETYGIIYTSNVGAEPTQAPVYYGYGDPNNVGTYMDPDGWNGEMPGKVHFEWNQPNTYFKICVVAKSCAKQSAVYEYHFEKMQVPDPVIGDFTENATDHTGSTTITWEEGYTIRYTTDGTTPSANIGQMPTGNVTSWFIDNLAPGTTVKAIAYKAGDDNYNPSNVVSKLYLPNGGQSGTSGSMVILNDLEDHSWSYYSDATNPIRSLKPVDVKITYNGNGTGNMTSSTENGANPTSFSENATGVKVGVDADENQFMYLKTLERADGNNGTGRCAYQVIPNPFSVRPTGTGNGNAKYRGFYRWRLKSIAGGSVYAAATGGTALVAGTATVDAETTLYFEPATGASPDDMIEVVFEALWAQAYVATTRTTTLSGGSYERNFYVLTGGIDGNMASPGTVSRYYPNGTTDGTTAATAAPTTAQSLSSISLSVDTKYEYIALSGSSATLTANNHDLIFGRGVSGTVNYIRGAGGNLTAPNYHIRLESGTFNYVSLLRGYWNSANGQQDNDQSTFSGDVNIKSTIGSDYDRAVDETSGPNIVQNMIMGTNQNISSTGNRNRKTIDVVVKSGKIGSDHTMNNNYVADAYQSLYMSVASSQTNVGERSLTIEGGEISSVAGGIDNNNQGNNNNGVRSLTVRMKGGTVRGAFYGGAAKSPASGDRYMVFTGGTVKSWLGAGCNGTDDDGGQTYGKSYVYVGGKTHVGGGTTVNGSEPGTVFGAGKGYAGGTGTSGEMSFGTNVVIADEAVIENDVYGGGNYGYALVNTDLYILGGTIQNNAFGGSNRKQGVVINVYMKDGTVENNIYGGSNTTGTISGLATVNVSGGTVKNVFGGGYGSSTNMAAGTKVNVSGGTINNNVYGGGEEGTVTSNTEVNVSGGTMNDVFGAGMGTSNSTALISGTTTVNVTGGTIANVYGGGENGNVTMDDGSSSNMVNVSFTLRGNHSVYNIGNNQRAHLTISSGNTTYGTLEWPRTGGNNTTTTGNVSVPMGVEITVTYSYSGTAPTNNRYTATYNGEDLINVTSQPANNSVEHFTIPSAEVEAPALASTVTINGGADVSGDVFGGGKLGTTAGSVVVNMKGGAVHGSVYGGALGEQHSVFVAGQHTVNVMGGRVYANVYGGSRNADDAYSFEPGTFATATNEETVCVVNVSGGQVDQQVYAAGYFGNCFGSVFAFVGQNAIYNAPNSVETAGSESAGQAYEATKLYIVGSVWAGGDWGTFTDHFGDPTISGKSNVYVDGNDYNTFTTDKSNGTYMCIDGSIYGSGTSCDAGKKEHTVMLRNYGQSEGTFATASRDFASIQRADYLVLDNVHVDFQGQGRINSLIVTEVYAIYEVTKAVITTGGSTLIMDAPTDQIMSFISASCGNVFTAALPESETNLGGYTAITPGTLVATPNKIRVNGGNYLKIYHDKLINNTSAGYGMLKGYAYMMASSGDNEATCAYARPRWCANDDNLFHINDGTYDNRNDGGFVSYVSDDNVFDEAGNAGTVQMAYENHTPGSKVGEQYFRIWRTTGQIHEREGVFDVFATGANVFKCIDVVIELPAWRGHDYYYKFQTKGEEPNYSTTTDYGTELMTFNAAIYGTSNNTDQWIYYDTDAKAQKLGENEAGQNDIRNNPDVNYGLVILPGTGDALTSPAIGETAAPALIINGDSDDFLAKVEKDANQVYQPVNKFTFTNNETAPLVTFRLTYSDLLSSNKTYEPMWVNLVQCKADGSVTDIVKVKLVVNTSTAVGRNFETEVYAVMNGEGSTAEEAHVQIVLPRFDLNSIGKDSEFTVQGIDWTPANNGTLVKVSDGNFTKDRFAMEFSATENYDGTTGWNELNPTVYDSKVEYDYLTAHPNDSVLVGTTGGRSQFSLDFDLTYNGQVDLGEMPEPELMGTLVYHMKFTNYVEGEGNGSAKEFTVTIKVYRRGKGGRYYLDGVNGKNSYDGIRPDEAMLTLSAIFNRGGVDHKGLLPGDNVYVVNQVTADDGLEWNGLTKGGQVKIYRYNGGHELAHPEVGIIDNSENAAYKGVLVKVPNGAHMIMRGIDLDGYYMNGGSKAEGTTVTADTALVTIENGGILELNQKVVLEQNYSTNDGGAVVVNNGGTLKMNHDATIKDNKTDGEGAGVYMDGTMIASDQVRIWDNKKGSEQNNVYLAGTDRVLQIGVDMDDANYKDLDYDATHPDTITNAKIGLSKPIEYFTAGVAEVVYSAETGWLVEPLNTQAVIVHDGSIYKLETGTDPNKLYWRDTWVTWVTSEPEGFALDNIDSEEDLAWVISIVNGENGCTADALGETTVVIVKDLDMKDHTWVPIGVNDNIVFKGILEGNGHVVEGIISSLNRPNLGMFGYTSGATIQNLVVKCNFNGVSNNVGTVIGTMDGGLLANVEAAGDITGDAQYTKNIGGLVGEAQAGSTIHSAFAVNTIKAQRTETVVGGLVAVNGGNLYNSYANVTLASGSNAATNGGLVGTNNGVIENCYVINPIGPAFAAANNGTIDICYAPKGTTTLVGTGTAAGAGCGTYDAVKGAKEIGYMYDDNAVEATNDYVVDELSYANGRIDKWPGLLCALNQWVKADPKGLTDEAPWFRSTSSFVDGDEVDAYINGDLPVLGFVRDNSLATEDGKYLFYGSKVDANGLDNLFETFAEKEAAMFLYGNAAGVEGGTGDNILFINEDAVLLQMPIEGNGKAEEYNEINAVTGVTFDNSYGKAWDYYGNPLTYDWHMMSTPLSNAAIGATYGSPQGNGNGVNLQSMTDGYFPNGLTPMNGDVKWDFYSYYEPEYHWINLKRTDHYHIDGGASIDYTNETTFTPGKGYMMAISQDSYLNNTGTLNAGDVVITLTNQEPDDLEYNKGWNLVGNPYQAYLDMTKLGRDAYTYDAEQKTYIPYSAGASNNPAVLSQYVHPHQAFFMHAEPEGTATTETFTFTYADMATVETTETSYFRGNDQVNYPLVNLFVENETGNRDLAVVELHRPELGGATKMSFMTSANFQIAASIDGQRYGLLFTPEGTDRVPVRFQTEEDGTFTLTWSTYNGDFTSLLLVDNMTGTITDMLRSDSYTFSATTDDYASRFYLTFSVTDVEEYNEGDNDFAWFDGSEWVINGKGNLDVVDVLGRTIYSTRLTDEQNRVNLNNVAKGVYMLRVSDGNSAKVQKVVVR